MHSTKQQKDDLRFLLKDKYHLSEIQIEKENFPEEIQKDIELLESGYPLDYIIGYTDFLGLKISLNHRPLIPRPETEYWTEKIIKSIDKESQLSILDIFCGSGCIGLALLKNFKNANCTFADINSDFLVQTKQNADANFTSQNQFELIQSDVFNKIKRKFDLIVANPPYVSKHDVVEESIKYEPSGAIFAHKNGLEFIERFLMDAQRFLNYEGRIFMEFGEGQKDYVEELLKKFDYDGWDFQKDQFDKWRWVEIG